MCTCTSHTEYYNKDNVRISLCVHDIIVYCVSCDRIDPFNT